jgi:hypothetical protein
MLHADGWREVQRDMARLMCEFWNILPLTGDTTFYQNGRKRCLKFRFNLKLFLEGTR